MRLARTSLDSPDEESADITPEKHTSKTRSTCMAQHVESLWWHRDFRTLWIGATISNFGSAITSLALPMTAVVILQASPAQMGVLGAVSTMPALLLSLLVGVWVDRVRRRPLLIGADLGR